MCQPSVPWAFTFAATSPAVSCPLPPDTCLVIVQTPTSVPLSPGGHPGFLLQGGDTLSLHYAHGPLLRHCSQNHSYFGACLVDKLCYRKQHLLQAFCLMIPQSALRAGPKAQQPHKKAKPPSERQPPRALPWGHEDILCRSVLTPVLKGVYGWGVSPHHQARSAPD